jgi:hypothetical protein
MQAWTNYDLDDFNYFACSARATMAEACGAENDVPSSPPTQSENRDVEVWKNEIVVNKNHDQMRQLTRIPFLTLTLVCIYKWSSRTMCKVSTGWNDEMLLILLSIQFLLHFIDWLWL